MSYEWYFAKESLVSLAVFYKDVESHIGYTTEPVTIDNVTYAVTGPFNGDGGGISGAELTFQIAVCDLGSAQQLRHLHELRVRRHGREGVLPGAESAAHRRVCAEHGRGGPLVQQRRASKRGSATSTTRRSPSSRAGTGSDVRSLGEETIFDFSTTYQVNDSFGIRFQVNNLTNEPLRISRDNSVDRLGSYDVYGRRALLDFTFKYLKRGKM